MSAVTTLSTWGMLVGSESASEKVALDPNWDVSETLEVVPEFFFLDSLVRVMVDGVGLGLGGGGWKEWCKSMKTGSRERRGGVSVRCGGGEWLGSSAPQRAG